MTSNYEISAPALLLCVALIVLSYKWLTKKFYREKPPLPPGPRGLPLVGNLPFLEHDLHRYFAKVSNTYGPIIKFQLGSRLCIVVSSPSVAKEILKDHDTIFANRDVPAVGFAGTYGGVDMLWSPYGDHWRMLRKICVRELLSNPRLEALYSLRQQEVEHMVSKIYNKVGKPIDVGEFVVLTMFDVIGSMLWGGTLGREEKDRICAEFRQVLEPMVRLLGELNLSDLFPVLRVFDLQGMERRMKRLNLWFDQIFDFVIDKRIKMDSEDKGKSSDNVNDFLQVLLQLTEQGKQKVPFTTTHIKAIFLDMMVAGTKTSSTTVEWALAETLRHPLIMQKILQELEHVVGLNNIVQEFHLPQLHFLNSIIKETLRLHPTAPLLIPRCPSQSTIVGGYKVPKGAKIFVNAWALQRDPKCWDQPLDFKPERFLSSTSEYDYVGRNFSYIPFGSGRRVCVGIPLAERMVPYLLATLLHSFVWKLPEGIQLDMTEEFGLELKKKKPLVAIPTTRLHF